MTRSLFAVALWASTQSGCSSGDGDVSFSTSAGGANAGVGSSGGSTGSTGGSPTNGGSSAGSNTAGGGAAGAAGTASAGGGAGGAGAGGTDAGGAGAGQAGSKGGSDAAGSGGSMAGSGPLAGSGGSGGTSACTEEALEICDGLDNDCDDEIDPPGTCPLTCDGGTFGGHVYYFCSQNATSYNWAAQRCATLGMALVAIESHEENDYVQANVPGATWIGARDEEEGTWCWQNGTQFWQGGEEGEPVGDRFFHWAEGQPNDSGSGPGQGEDCAVLQPDDGAWNDVACALTNFNYTCETPEQ